MPHSSWTLEPITFQSVKSKLVHKPRTDDKERLEHAFFTAISGAQTALKLISGVASDVGIGPPGLQTGLSGLLFVLDAIQVSFLIVLQGTYWTNGYLENISKRS
jgi:hypothetical protein